MRRDSLTELGHAYWKRSSNAKHHPPKPPRKPLTVGNRVIRVPWRRWKGVKLRRKGDYSIKTFREMRIYFYEIKRGFF